MFSVVQISDSHVSPRITHFNANWEAARALLPRLSPDLIVHTGDATLDGADMEADCTMAAAGLADAPAPVRVVPGNHDVGDLGAATQPPTAARIARHERHFGACVWTEDRPGWRLQAWQTRSNLTNGSVAVAASSTCSAGISAGGVVSVCAKAEPARARVVAAMTRGFMDDVLSGCRCHGRRVPSYARPTSPSAASFPRNGAETITRRKSACDRAPAAGRLSAAADG